MNAGITMAAIVAIAVPLLINAIKNKFADEKIPLVALAIGGFGYLVGQFMAGDALNAAILQYVPLGVLELIQTITVAVFVGLTGVGGHQLLKQQAKAKAMMEGKQ